MLFRILRFNAGKLKPGESKLISQRQLRLSVIKARILTFRPSMNSAHWMLPSLLASKPSNTTLSSCLLRKTPNLDIISSNSSLSRTPLLLVSNCCKRYGYHFELNNLNFRNAWKMGSGMTLTSKTPLS